MNQRSSTCNIKEALQNLDLGFDLPFSSCPASVKVPCLPRSVLARVWGYVSAWFIAQNSKAGTTTQLPGPLEMLVYQNITSASYLRASALFDERRDLVVQWGKHTRRMFDLSRKRSRPSCSILFGEEQRGAECGSRTGQRSRSVQRLPTKRRTIMQVSSLEKAQPLIIDMGNRPRYSYRQRSRDSRSGSTLETPA